MYAYTSPGRLPELRDGQGNPLPLRHTAVHAAVRGHIAAVQVRQRFHNASDHPIEVVYTFPLPENSAVSDMRMTVGTRVIEAEIMRRDDARRTYETARSEGHTAALLEQERPNVFTQSVANIAPGEDIDVEVRYLQTLTYDAGEYELVFPMVVGTRYDPGGGSVPDAARISPPVVGRGVRTGHDISIEVDVQAGFPIVAWDAPTHEIVATPAGGNLRVELARADELPNRDFVLRYRVSAPKPQAAVFVGEPDAAGRGHYLMVVHPPAADVDAMVGRREVVFVVDRSGSMHGKPLALAKQTTRELMAQLRPVDTFNVVGFASGTERLFDGPRPVNAQNLVAALEFIDGMSSGGGTQMADAIDAALSDDVAPGFNRYVLFLTDGRVGNETQIIRGARQLVARQARRGDVARVFGIGIGAAPNRYLIQGVSRAGDGVARTISSRRASARAVNALMHDIDHPALTKLSLPRASPLGLEHFPSQLPDLFVSQPVVVMGRYEGEVGASVTLEARLGARALRIDVPVERIEGANALLSTLWARAKVEELDTQLWHEPYSSELVEQITQLGLEHRLVTAYTSFVAVDRTRRVGNGNPERIEQPVNAPADSELEGSGADFIDPELVVSTLPQLEARAEHSLGSQATYPTTSATTTTSTGEFKRTIRVQAQPIASSNSVDRTIRSQEIRNIPVGSSTSRDFTQVIESSATASRDSAGISLAGATGAESKFTVEGASVNNPAFGTVGASVVQEFVEEVEVLESGYEAERGGASGGQVAVRRTSGTNTVRGVARFTYSPRLAKPRFIVATDNAVRTTETLDYGMQGVITASGPILEDRLFWTAGVSMSGSQGSLVQAFHHRVDEDGSGGYEGCPHRNGAFDCAEGRGYIATRKFAEQEFRTRSLQVGYQLGLDGWLSPRHGLRLTVQGSPSFARRSFRQAASSPFDPTLTTDPLGGSSLVANGVVNDHFGWDRSDSLLSVLSYQGRVADDRIELDANVAYSRFASQTAWRLDDPSQRDLPAIQYTDAEGGSLFDRLDEDGSLDLAPGIDQACNDPSRSGEACPVRQWMSGGLGQYGEDVNHRAEANLAATHYFNGAGAHKLKYGVAFEHLTRHTVSRYSGRNASDFYGSCTGRGLGEQPDDAGGEWCYDQGAGEYAISNELRVDNHRFIRVDLDNPDQRTSYGYGRVRKEEGELRAIATPQGAGIRAAAYDETLHTSNYGLFLQDRWAILSNLYLSAGVRWELQDMRDILGQRAIFIRDNIAPRVGVVYDWTDEGRSRLYASYGWFFNPMPMQLTSRVFGGLVDVRRTYRDQDCRGRQVTVAGETFAREEDGLPTEYCTDSATTTSQLTGGAVVPRLRGQYNQQLQLGYDHELVEDLVVGTRWQHTALARAVEDVSTNGGLDHIIANPGEAVSAEDLERQRAQCTGLDARLQSLALDDPSRPALARELQHCQSVSDAFERVGELFDRPRRNFDAFTLELRKRFARGWLLQASYTFSRLRGNYDGFVDPITGAINLGSSVQYDTPELVRNSFGPLSFDTPHRIKLDGFYTMDLREAGRLTLGSSLRMASGYPISLRGGHPLYGGAPIYILPRGAGGRIQPSYRWNLSLSYGYPLPGDLELEASIRIINVTNARATVRVDETYSYQHTRPVAGGDAQDLKHTKVQSATAPNDFYQRTIVARQGNFGVETSFQTPLAASFELQLRF